METVTLETIGVTRVTCSKLPVLFTFTVLDTLGGEWVGKEVDTFSAKTNLIERIGLNGECEVLFTGGKHIRWMYC